MHDAMPGILRKRTIAMVITGTLIAIAGLATLVRFLIAEVSTLTIAWITPMVVFGCILVPLGFIAVLLPLRAGIVREHRQLLSFEGGVRRHPYTGRSDLTERVIEGRVVPLDLVNNLLFSPITAHACVLWATEVSASQWPTGGDGRARVSASIPFGVETSTGIVRIEQVHHVVVPRVEGFARRVGMDGSKDVDDFYHGIGGEDLSSYELARDAARSRMTYLRNYELVVPVYSHIRILAVVYDGAQNRTEPVNGSSTANLVHVASAKVFVGNPAEISLRLDGALARALKHRRRELATGFLMLFGGLVYVALVLLDYIN